MQNEWTHEMDFESKKKEAALLLKASYLEEIPHKDQDFVSGGRGGVLTKNQSFLSWFEGVTYIAAIFSPESWPKHCWDGRYEIGVRLHIIHWLAFKLSPIFEIHFIWSWNWYTPVYSHRVNVGKFWQEM